MNSPTELRFVALRCPGYVPAFALGWLVAVGFAFGVAAPANAADLYWSGTGNNQNSTSAWATVSNWSSAATSGTTPASVPGALDTAFFNTGTNNGTRWVSIVNNTSIGGMVFNNTGETGLVNNAGANNFRWNIGAGGITVNAGAGDVIFGTGSRRANVTLTASQTWSNDSGNTLSTVGSTNSTSGGYNPQLDLGANTLTVSGSGNTTIGSNRIVGSAATAFIKNGTGKLTFNSVVNPNVSGSNANDPNFSGDVQINGGTVEYGRSGAIPNTADILFNTASDTATFDTAGFNGTIASLTLGGAANSLAIVDTVGTGTGTLTLGGNVVYDATNNPGRAEINGILNLGAAARTFTIGDSANTSTDLRVAALVSGAVGLTKSGAGRMDLVNANNSFSGGLTINAGTVRASAGTSAGQSALGTGTVTLAGGELVVYANSAQSPNNPTVVTANSTITSDRLASPFNGLLMTLGQLSIGGQTLTVQPGENITGSRASIQFAGATLSSTPTFDVLDNAAFFINGIGDGGGGFGFVKNGVGEMRLGGTSTYSGLTTINSGTLTMTGQFSGSGGITNNASLVFNSAADQVVGSAINGTGALTKLSAVKLTLSSTANTYSGLTTISAGTLEVTGQLPGTGGITNNASLVFNSAADQAVSGAINGSGGLQKLGAGSLSLTSLTNTYAGATAVDAGTLLVNGIHNGGAGYTVAAGATLGGSGGIFATVAGAGTISPGNSPGILAVRSVDPTAGTDFTFEMTTVGDPTWNANTASGNDVLRMFGSTPITTALTAANTVTVNFGMNLTVGDTIRGGFYTERDSDFSSLVNDAAWAYTFTGGLLPEGASIVRSVTQVPSATFADGTVANGWVTTFAVVAVPEPSSLVLVSLGVMGLLWFRRR